MVDPLRGTLLLCDSVTDNGQTNSPVFTVIRLMEIGRATAVMDTVTADGQDIELTTGGSDCEQDRVTGGAISDQ